MSAIEITTVINCRVQCQYCPQTKLVSAYTKKSKTYYMSLADFKTCIDKIPLNMEIWFSGFGEPWLNPECTQMILYAHQRGHKIIVCTTLVGMKASDIALIESVPFQLFCVHLPSEEENEKILAYNEYLEVLDVLLKSKIKLKYLFRGKAIHPKVKSLINKSIYGFLWYQLVKRLLSSLPHTRAGNIEITDKPKPRRRRGVIGCRRQGQFVLLPNGDVVLCCMDYGLKHVIGNLLVSDYHLLFQSDEYLKILQGLKDESIDILCRYCEKYVVDKSLSAKLSKLFRDYRISGTLITIWFNNLFILKRYVSLSYLLENIHRKKA